MGLFNKITCKKCGQRNDPKEKTCFYCEAKLDQRVEKDDQRHKQSRIRKPVLIYTLIGIFMIAILPLPNTLAENISIPYTIQYVQSSEIELGESQVNQQGTEGLGITETKVVAPTLAYLLGKSHDVKYSMQKTTRTTQAPVSKIVANGTKRYQYMWCSNGSYRYYTNDQLKNPNAGFTHKSPDACSQNKQGHMTQLSDAAPQKPTTIYNTSPRLPTTTRCYDSYLGGFSCYTY